MLATPHTVARALPPSPVRQPASATSVCPTLPGAIPTPRPALPITVPGALYLSHFPPSTRHRTDPPPHFPSHVLPRAPTELKNPPAPHSALFYARAPFSPRHLLHCQCRFTVRPFHPPPLSPFEAALTLPLPHQHSWVMPPLPPATGAPSPPMNAAARSILHRLYAAPPLGFAPPPTTLPGVHPVAPASSLAAPCRRPAATKPTASKLSSAQAARGACVVSVPGYTFHSCAAGCFSAGPGRQAEAQPAFWPATHGRPPSPWAVAPGWIGPGTVRGLKLVFQFINPRKFSKLSKFIETGRNVQKWLTKFCWTPLGQIYAVGLTKFTFVQ
jgi:hypothetical protein